MAQRVRAVVARAKGSPVAVEEIVVPDPGPGEAVVAIHKELTLVRSEDPGQGGQAARDGEVVVSALNEMSVALVSSGGL